MAISDLDFRGARPVFTPKSMTIAVDFDGTIVKDNYPGIGEAMPGAVEVLKKLRKEGYPLVLWTCRTGKHLAQAVAWCAERGIRFDTINGNLRSNIQKYGDDTRKVSASLYIDDRGLEPLPHWDDIYEIVHERLPTLSDTGFPG